ncbi:cupin domain-containing protein [Nitratidesulfovibrio sp. SRB-5]|uniref:cupin domain-containing protein n=1 Tax=Nitratidesulfovibrio sp. SRB-5 TaxID=2872636 RepID=UPI001025A5E3|nr:cupin domain-containing protein [Nitratidesulfovibrio sp. SRB-5]MBZ2172553.1 cupin domain-containing protein [Nitratidesulfovibrio sp. SRB-5]RXF77095.1 cupin domain-containing protein [Desulfovibrio sp. DS-1]
MRTSTIFCPGNACFPGLADHTPRLPACRLAPSGVLAALMLGSLMLGALTLSGGCAARHPSAPAALQSADQTAGQRPLQPASQAVSSVQLVQSERSWDGATLPAYPQGQPQVTILRITIPAGARLPLHHHPVINAGVLTRGQLLVTTSDGKELRLAAGDPIVEVVNNPHQGFNPGSEPAEIIVFYAGQAGTPLAVKQGQ